MQFIHTGDLHLDSPFRGLNETPEHLWHQIHRSTFTAFQRIVDEALGRQVDFMLIVGDIYDRDHHSAEAEDFFAQQCQRLADQHIPVYLSYGNHDYQPVNADQTTLPANVHVFDNQVTSQQLQTKDGQTVELTGFSYAQRWLTDDIVNDYPAANQQADWNIGMLHGAIQTNDAQQDHYAPFRLEELLNLHYDYWALGHIHKHQILNQQPPIVYCGNPQGRHQNEDGQHGYYLVQSDGDRLVPQFKPIAPIEWVNRQVDLSAAHTSQEALHAIMDQVDEHDQQLLMINLVVNDSQLEPRMVQLINSGALLSQVQNELEAHFVNWWPYKISQQSNPHLPKMTDLDAQYWQAAAKQVFTEEELNNLIADKLLQNPYLADQLQNPDLINQLRINATNLLQDGGSDDED